MIDILLAVYAVAIILLGAGLLLRILHRRYGRRMWLPVSIGTVILVLPVLTGHVNFLWLAYNLGYVAGVATIATAFAGLLGLLKFLLPRLLALLPWLIRWRESRRRGGAGVPPGVAEKPMDRAQALAVLGLEEGASREEILAAHRRLIQKIHPDRGGTQHLAGVLNRARDMLLG